MITFIDGILSGVGVGWLDVSVGGVTLRISVPKSTLDSIGAPGAGVRLATSMQFRDDTFTLYGFSTEEDRSAFESLIGVNGVGPKVALNVLSTLTRESLVRSVLAGDTGAFKAVSGVGSKTAQRIILELSGKLEFSLTSNEGISDYSDVLDALTSLGYSVPEATKAINSLVVDGPSSLEERVRLCLESLGRSDR